MRAYPAAACRIAHLYCIAKYSIKYSGLSKIYKCLIFHAPADFSLAKLLKMRYHI